MAANEVHFDDRASARRQAVNCFPQPLSLFVLGIEFFRVWAVIGNLADGLSVFIDPELFERCDGVPFPVPKNHERRIYPDSGKPCCETGSAVETVQAPECPKRRVLKSILSILLVFGNSQNGQEHTFRAALPMRTAFLISRLVRPASGAIS